MKSQNEPFVSAIPDPQKDKLYQENSHELQCQAGNWGRGEGWGERTAETDPKPVQGLSSVVQTFLQQRQGRGWATSDQLFGSADEKCRRLQDLEKHIADLRTQAGVEELEGENKLAAAQKSGSSLIYTEIGNIVFTSQEKTKWLFATNYYV